MIKTVVFDIGRVLVDFLFDSHIARFGHSKEILDKIRKATFESGFWCELDRGIESYEEVMERFKKVDLSVAKEIEEVLTDTMGIVKQRKFAIPLVKELQNKGLQVLALSNFPEKVYLQNKEELSFLEVMDGYILSYADKVIKPDVEIYELLRARYGFKPQECVFIDDTQINLDTAARLGWNTIRYDSYEQVLDELAALGVVAKTREK